MGGVELRRVSAPRWAGRISRAAIMVGFSAGLAACSTDTVRFNSNPFETADASGGAKPAHVARAETKPVYSSQALPPPTAAAAPAPVASNRQAPRSADTTGAARQWSWEGGTPIIVAQGETVDSLALRYNVPGTAILQANELQAGTSLRAGQSLVIPKLNYASQRNAPASVAAAPAAAKTGAPQVTHVVASGDTMMSLSRRYHRPVKEIAAANRMTADARLKVGSRVVIPGVIASTVPAAKPETPAVASAPAKPAPVAVAAKPVAAPTQVASIEPTQTARLASPSIDAGAKPNTTGAPQFRWPVRGRVISSFGPIPNGQQNDGINLAVPEGTKVQAAEDGTVAYAGNELKGYGNLVLVRHADGFVTAYAHTSELMVKRGDPVKRGQVIAKSGATGSVNAPQLHFEIRKGSTPVDPTKYLPGA